MDSDPSGPLTRQYRRYAFICNGRAGAGLRHQPLGHIEESLQTLGHETRIFPCEHSSETTALSAIAAGFDRIVAVGGDGTINGCAAAVWRAGPPIALGVLPAGTLNHFARDLGIGDPADAELALMEDHVRCVDIATVNGIPFVNNAGIGLYPVIVRKREDSRRHGVPKWTAFLLAIIRAMAVMPLRRLTIDADGRRLSHRTPFLFVGNNDYRMEGLRIGTRERLDAGVLGVCASASSGRLALIRLAIRALFGRLREERDFWNATAAHLTVRTKHAHAQVTLDGELKRLRSPLEYRSHRGELRVLAPVPAVRP